MATATNIYNGQLVIKTPKNKQTTTKIIGCEIVGELKQNQAAIRYLKQYMYKGDTLISYTVIVLQSFLKASL